MRQRTSRSRMDSHERWTDTKAQDLVEFLGTSETKVLLREEQAHRKYPSLTPKKNVVTRWSSVVTMLVRLVRYVQQQQVIHSHHKMQREILGIMGRISDDKLPLLFTNGEWLAVKECVLLLMPIATITNFLEAEDVVTISSVIPYYELFREFDVPLPCRADDHRMMYVSRTEC